MACSRDADPVRLSQDEKVGKICRGLWISEKSHYRWRRLYGGLKVDQARRLLRPRLAACTFRIMT